jgi:hypothetical protein
MEEINRLLDAIVQDAYAIERSRAGARKHTATDEGRAWHKAHVEDTRNLLAEHRAELLRVIGGVKPLTVDVEDAIETLAEASREEGRMQIRAAVDPRPGTKEQLRNAISGASAAIKGMRAMIRSKLKGHETIGAAREAFENHDPHRDRRSPIVAEGLEIDIRSHIYP